MIQATAQSDTVSPIAPAELAAFIGVESSDPLLSGMLIAATDAVINYIRLDLLEREWVAIVSPADLLPVRMSPYPSAVNTFELPFTALMEVQDVMAGGDPIEYTLEAKRRPAKITLLDWDYTTEVQITYTAGLSIVPVAIEEAIKMLAAYLYDHRGACDVGEAMSKSGASVLLRPYRVEVAL